MSARTIEWHKGCLRHCRASLLRAIVNRDSEVKRLAEHIDRLQNEVMRGARQIAEAERRGKKSFDADRFLKGKL